MNYKYIHLLYVPTMACNMQCRYCYLEDNTKDLKIKNTLKNMNDYRKYNKETFDKLEQKQKDDIILKLKQDKESMTNVLNYIQQMEEVLT